MAELPARIQRLTVPHGRRILVTSDIHGNIPYFEGALKLAGFSDRDELIINGDFLEKGSESLRLCRMLMELQKQGNVHVICGNCDDWAEMFLPSFPDYAHDYILRYIKFKRCGLLWDMYLEQGMDPLEQTDFRPAKKLFHEKYPEIWDFLGSLPHALETDRFVFAHAGMTPGKPLREHSASELDRVNALLQTGRRFDRWLVVGHWPVMLYGENIVCANPVI